MSQTLHLKTLAEVSGAVVPGFPDYIITKDGRVFRTTFRNRVCSKIRLRPLQLKLRLGNQGYYTVGLWRDGVRHSLWLHSLVLRAYAGERPPGKVAAHRNGKRLDCRLENLRWATPRENYDDMFDHGTNPAGERNPGARLTDAKVIKIRKMRRDGYKTWQLAAHYRMCQSTIQKVCNRRLWRHVA